MAKGDKPKDARETLSQLERRLRDLERELRASASDAAPDVTPPPAAEPAQPPLPEPAPPPPPTRAPTPPPPAAIPGPVPADIEVLVDEARVRADALRESLTSLVGVNDHLRETANTVIEAHGRALADLDAALTAAERDAHAAREPEGREAFEAIAPTTPPPAQPPWEQPEPTRPRRRRWLAVLVTLLLVAAAAAAAYVVRERRRDQAAAPPAPAAAVQIAVAVPNAMQLGIVGARRYNPTAAPQAVCAGIVAAAIVAGDGAAGCPSAIVVTRVTDSAFGLVGPRLRDGRGRRCFSIAEDGDLARHDDVAASNDRRAAAVEEARTTATGAARADQLPPAQVVRAGNDAAAQAAGAWDDRRSLRARAVAARPGGACVLPTPSNLRTGTYPLAHRLSLIASVRSRETPAVAAAAEALRTAYGGETALDAHVLR